MGRRDASSSCHLLPLLHPLWNPRTTSKIWHNVNHMNLKFVMPQVYFTLNWLRFLCLPKDKTSITLTFAILYFILLSCLPCPFCPQYLPLLTGMQNRWTKIFACLDLGGFYIFSTRCLPSSRLHWPPRVAFFSSQRHQIPKLDPMPSGDFLSNFGRNCWRFFVHNWTLCHQVIFWLQL